jgi:hypothetical protein
MKKLTIIIIIILNLSISVSYAQDGFTGIYKNANDFLNGKVTHSGKHTHVKLHETFNRDNVEVKDNDSTFSYSKKDVFGYLDKEGQTYRFFNNDIYPILNPTEKILFYKQTFGSGMKNSPLVENYFFSKDATTEILPLTLRNVETVFSGETLFESFIEIHFKNDGELTEYDHIHKMYKINRLLELSKTEKIK